MTNWKVVLAKIRTLEPIIITDAYNTGGYYRCLDYIPASTIAGAIISSYAKSMGNSAAGKILGGIWSSNAYPYIGDEETCKPEIDMPLPLPLLSLSRKKSNRNSGKKNDEEIISTALIAAKILDEMNLSSASKLDNLDPKVERVFVQYNGCEKVEPHVKVIRPYPRKVYTHVSLRHDTRTVAWDKKEKIHWREELREFDDIEVAWDKKEEKGFLYTIEYIEPPAEFIFRAFMDASLLDFLKVTPTLKIGSHKRKGYGMVEFEILQSVDLDKYKDIRRIKIEKNDSKYVTLDAVTHVSPEYLEKLGKPVYQRTRISNLKNWLDGRFIIYRNLYSPGSVLVYKREQDPEKYVSLETAMITDRIYLRNYLSLNPVDIERKMIPQINMVFFDNPVHFIFKNI